MSLEVQPLNAIAAVDAEWPSGHPAPGRSIATYRWSVRASDGSWEGVGEEPMQTLSLFAPQGERTREGSLCVASVQSDGLVSDDRCTAFVVPEMRRGLPVPALMKQGVGEAVASNARRATKGRPGATAASAHVYCEAAGGTTTSRGACEAIEKSLGWPETDSYSGDWGLGWRFDNRNGGMPEVDEPTCAELGDGTTNLGLSCRHVAADGSGGSDAP